MAISVERLVKTFGTQNAVDDISFEAKEGEILGFLGPNGAGKSTTMKIATCFLPPTSGLVQVNGLDVTEHPIEVKKLIGYLPEHNPLYLDMYVHEYLRFIGSLHGLSGKLLSDRAKKMVALTGLTREQNKKVGMLSKGYRQRVGLAQALIHDPSVLILDEPTTGLDPNQIVEIRNLIKSISESKTVILSTHIMQEVQAICDRAIIINRGKLVADSTVGDLGKSAGSSATLIVEYINEVSPDLLQDIEGIANVRNESTTKLRVEVKPGQDVREEIFKVSAAKGQSIIGMNQSQHTLEEIFQNLTQPR